MGKDYRYEKGFRVGQMVSIHRRNADGESLSSPVKVDEVLPNGIVMVDGMAFSAIGESVTWDRTAVLVAAGDPLEDALAEKLARRGLVEAIRSSNLEIIETEDLSVILKLLGDVGALVDEPPRKNSHK
jgi:hypothetical protein